MEARQPVRRRARQATRRRARQPRQPTRRRGEGRRACRVRSSGMSGPIVGHVGPDRRACRARSSGMSGPIVGHVGHVGRRSSGRRLSEIALLGFHRFVLVPTDENMGAVLECSGPVGMGSPVENYWSCSKIVHRSIMPSLGVLLGRPTETTRSLVAPTDASAWGLRFLDL